MPVVEAKCARGDSSPFVNPDGYYFPCCWVMNIPEVITLKEFLGDTFEELNINNSSLEEAMNSNAMKRIRDSWEDGSFQPCVWYCKQKNNLYNVQNEREFFIDLKKWSNLEDYKNLNSGS